MTVGIAPGAYRARWSGRNLQRGGDVGRRDENPPDTYRLQIWPGPTEAPRAEIKHWPGNGRSGARRPARAAGRRGSGGARRGRRHGAHRRRAAARRPPGGRRRAHAGTGRSAPTASCAGSSRAAASTARRCTPSTRACCPSPTTSAASPSTAAPPTPSGWPTRCAPPTPSSPGATSPSRTSSTRCSGVEALLELGYGQLANGPVTLLRRYAEVAEAHGVADAADRHGPGPRRPVPARARRDLRRRRALHVA